MKRFVVGSSRATLAVALAISAPVLAQSGQQTPAAAELATDEGIQDIIVTAQKRAENVQDVPIAISAFTSEALKERAVGNISQISNLAPNVNLDAGTPFSGSPSVLSAFIRGIGSDDFAFNIDPGVGIYVDGVFLARSVGANQDLLDVERVEVLKGPQGTLFGRNTIGGAISIVTRTPGDTFRFTGDVTTGSYNRLQVRGSADIPVTSDFSASVTFGVKSREGYVKRIPYPDARANNGPSYTAFPSSGYSTATSEGGDNNWNLRGKLHWSNGGAFRVTLSGDYTREDSTGLPNTLLATTQSIPGNFAGTTNLPGTAFDPTGQTGFLFAGLYNFCIGASAAQIAARNAAALCGVRGTQFDSRLRLPALAGINVDSNPANDVLPYDSRFISSDIDKSYATGNSFSKMTNWGVGATVDVDIAQNVALKSITAYRNLDWRSGIDVDGSPLNILQLSFYENQWQFSQELQLTGSAFAKKLNFVLGGYYFKEKGGIHDYVTIDEGLLQVDGPNALETENYAVFGQVDIRPIDFIGITLGGRYTHENKKFEGGQTDLNGFNYKLFNCADANGSVTPNGAFPLAPVTCAQGLAFPNPANPIQVYPPGVNTKVFNNFSPKIGIQIHPAERVMIYGSWSKGYKTGGWTTRLTNPQLNVPDFNEEKATTFEVGFKSTLFDRRLQLNAAAFTTDYTGIQLNFQDGNSPTIQNAGSARIKGFEVEAVIAPTNGLTINANVGYVDAYYTSVLPGVLRLSAPNPIQAGTFVGAPLPKTPDWKLNISPRYELDLAGGGSLVLIADWTHTTPIWNNALRTYALRRPTTDVINASMTFRPANDHWSLSVGGTNLTNTRYVTTGNENAAGGVIFGTYNRPAEWYARLGVKF
jgi:outer membrane receptor protein involved in Fe transport